MSRLIVKNLANSVTEKKLKETFSAKGVVTDVQLKYTKDGKFRHFGFVGYKSIDAAQAAIKFFNGTFLNATKINVELCSDLGDPNKPKAWSKYSADSSAYKKIHGDPNEEVKKVAKAERKQKEKDEKKKKDPVTQILKKHKDDPLFAEFLESHGQSASDILKDDVEVKETDSESGSDSEQESEQEEKVANKDISDLEYLKLKKEGTKDKKDDSGDKTDKNKDENEDKSNVQAVEKGKSIRDTLFTVKLKGLTYKAKKKDIKHFFHPLKPKSVRLCRNVKGIAYAGFNTEKELKQALHKNKSFLAGKQIYVASHSKPMDQSNASSSKWVDQEESVKNEESIAESGRIFVRNLAYTTTEHDVEELFSKYGPTTEVTVPIDKLSRKVKGFALVTYMIPENAARAYAELDGKVFQGRMLHLLPGKAKFSLEELANSEELTYKQRLLLKQKAQAGSSHNWNTLFLGANAVADAMAKNYNTSKENVLNAESTDSVAVRLALGETQLVAETKEFLEKNGVYLDAFNQAPKQRSKFIIIAKNLPAGTTSHDLKTMFAEHGELGRIVLPPSGITAIIEFMDPSEARNAFTKLAYTKYKHLPLYLEWAPEDTFVSGTQVDKNQKILKPKTTTDDVNSETPAPEEEKEESEEDDTEPEPDTILFVKNLNFSTTEISLKNHFSNCGKIASVTVARKKDIKNPGKMSMGYGFVQFKLKKESDKALKTLQHSLLDGHALELKRSNRIIQENVATSRKKAQVGKQTGTKIIVRNVPFQAHKKEIKELFKVFGELKAIRLPKKMVGTGPHRGFAFVDFVTKADAKRAFKALCQSTHLYGRRLVLEWAAEEETVEELRKRTAKHFHQEGPIKSKKSVLQVEEGDEEDI